MSYQTAALLSALSGRYYDYMFGNARKKAGHQKKRFLASELSELRVWITSPDSGCESYPNDSSDESCEWHELVFIESPGRDADLQACRLGLICTRVAPGNQKDLSLHSIHSWWQDWWCNWHGIHSIQKWWWCCWQLFGLLSLCLHPIPNHYECT